MLIRVAQAVSLHIEPRISDRKKFQDRSRERFTIARLYQQTVLPVPDNFQWSPTFVAMTGPAGERFHAKRSATLSSREAITTMSHAA